MMKNTILFFLLSAFSFSCKDGGYPPTLSDEIAGHWTRADNPNWHYQFEGDFCTTWIFDFGATIQPRWYAVEEVGERSLELTNMNTGEKLLWGFSQTTDTTVTVVDYTGGQPYFYFNLKRE